MTDQPTEREIAQGQVIGYLAGVAIFIVLLALSELSEAIMRVVVG